MTVFLKKLVGFSIWICIVLGLLAVVNYHLLSNFFHPRKITNAKQIILGDSHAVTGMDPGLLSSCENFSRHSEHPFFTYHKLKWIIQGNPSVKRVLFTFSHHNLMSDMSLTSEGWQVDMLPRYFPIIEIDTLLQELDLNKTILKNIVIQKIGFMNGSTVHDTKNSIIKDYSSSNFKFLGAFLSKNNSNLSVESLDLSIKRHYENRAPESKNRNVYYLREIIAFCKLEKIQVVIVVTPLFHEYRKRIPLKVKNSFNEILEELKTKGITVIDMSSMSLPDESFGDGDHLNAFGAKDFSAFLSNLDCIRD